MSEVLALKYRPQSFDEVVGQEQTTGQIKAALKNGTLGHSLLFCGTRGSGKTTTARIVAKELNRKLGLDVDHVRWEAESKLYITEVDAASNTGVDNVRELIENIRYSTQGHRVLLIDESHMLSKSAWNALLKPLEEPPPGVTFILLTTEPNKVIPTVASRCQKYEFLDVDVSTISNLLLDVANKEGLELDTQRAQSIALRGEGSIRDALSILQKDLSGETTPDNSKNYYELVGAIYNQDVVTALELVGDIKKAEDPRVIIQTLEKWFYYCSLENFGQATPVRNYFGDSKLSFDLKHLQKLFDICLDVERSFTATPNSKIVLDMGILKLCL